MAGGGRTKRVYFQLLVLHTHFSRSFFSLSTSFLHKLLVQFTSLHPPLSLYLLKIFLLFTYCLTGGGISDSSSGNRSRNSAKLYTKRSFFENFELMITDVRVMCRYANICVVHCCCCVHVVLCRSVAQKQQLGHLFGQQEQQQQQQPCRETEVSHEEEEKRRRRRKRNRNQTIE